jgi:hypothetical protein
MIKLAAFSPRVITRAKESGIYIALAPCDQCMCISNYKPINIPLSSGFRKAHIILLNNVTHHSTHFTKMSDTTALEPPALQHFSQAPHLCTQPS